MCWPIGAHPFVRGCSGAAKEGLLAVLAFEMAVFGPHCAIGGSGRGTVLLLVPRLVIDAHLAQGIPALMSAAGAGRIFSLNERYQFDCNSTDDISGPNGWPQRSKYPGRWCHSDMKDVAYFFNYEFYKKAIEVGSLKKEVK